MKKYILSMRIKLLRLTTKNLLINKLTLLFIICCIFQVKASALAQTVTIQQKNISFVNALREIKKQTGYTVICSSEILNSTGPSDLNIKNASLAEALNILLKPKGLTYFLEGKSIAIRKASIAAQDKPEEIKSSRIPEEHPIKGTVNDETGKPLTGVTVTIKKKKRTTTTDKLGAFSISADAGDVIAFSYVGYKPLELTVADQTDFHVSLTRDETGLQGVVVVGYGTSKKINLTGSVESIKSTDLEKMPVINTEAALAGKLPGLSLRQSSGEPGNDDPELNIRGYGAPLIIVDGTQQGSFSNLAMEEIASISILKDASAAVYGAQAGNGVILVTTKRGATGKAKITFDPSFTLSTPTRYPKLMNSYEYASLYDEGQLNDGIATGTNTRFSATDIAHFKNNDDPLNYPNTNWYNVAARKFAPQQKYNLTVDGGNDIAKYFFSIGHSSQDGLWRSDDANFKRYNVRSNVDVKINDALTASIDLSGRKEVRNDPNTSVSNIFLDILRSQPMYNPTYPDPTKFPALGRVGANGLIATQSDVVGYNNDERDYFTGTAKLKYDFPFLKGLYAEGRLTYYKDDDFTRNWSQAYSTYNYDYAHNIYSLVSVNGLNGLTEYQVINRRTTQQYSLNYDGSFGKSTFKGLLLFEGISQSGDSFSAGRINYITTAVQQLFAGSTATQTNNGTAYESGRASYVGRLDYSYASKYLLEATFRYDGSPTFAPNDRWGFFPSLSAGWILTEEKFLSNIHGLDFLKFRISYSNTGNDNTGNFQYLTGYTYNDTYVIGGTPQQTIRTTGLANPYITWENIHTFNLGWDAKLFNHFSLTLDAFYRKREGILATRALSLPYSFGATLPAENINSQDDRGIEAVLGYRGKVGQLGINLTGNVSWNRSKWLHYDEPVYTDPDQIRINKLTGKPVDQTYGYVANGFFQSKQQIATWPVNQDGANNSTIKPGDLIYKDINHDGKIDWRDQTAIGHGETPLLYYGMNMDFTYKNFSLNALWQGAAEFNFQITADAQSTFTQDENGYEYFYNNRWTPSNPNASYPRASIGLPANQSLFSSFWYKSGAYLRLKSLMLSYALPKSLTTKHRIPAISVFIAGTNLLTFDNLSKFGYDPEAPMYNNGLYYPQQTTYSLGARVTF